MTDSVYKYLPPERLDVLESNRIRFTSVISLNDPYEYLMKLGDGELFVDHSLGDNGFKFLSLSRNNSNLLMWSHYSESHKGFVLEFSRNHPYFCPAEPIRYRKRRANLNGAKLDSLSNANILKSVVLEKALDWAYEEEERLFLQDIPQDNEIIGYDEWSQPIILNKFPKDSLKGVYLGVRTTDKLKENVIKILKSYDVKIPLYQMKTAKDYFAVEECEISYT
ncbi:hypothetical protein CEG15_16375 [Vibrio anguillarum]|uniref:DUF2971 domain-containing protein n=1 Tax=Vibrio anguillarum TaxID=55601 RepID=UPI000B53BC9D|nr:DUF2971 domain-containing protein [Vibrio anguillarum]ASG01715.1 hypothetical protein CEG15_16375 [Vibrio anguillarum]